MHWGEGQGVSIRGYRSTDFSHVYALRRKECVTGRCEGQATARNKDRCQSMQNVWFKSWSSNMERTKIRHILTSGRDLEYWQNGKMRSSFTTHERYKECLGQANPSRLSSCLDHLLLYDFSSFFLLLLTVILPQCFIVYIISFVEYLERRNK